MGRDTISQEAKGPGGALTGPVERVLSFGPFRLHAAERLLLENGRAVPLGSHALDILAMLVERRGEVVAKNAIAARIWPGTIVEDVKLRVHVSALRRAMGDGMEGRRYIVTIPGRGYQFVGAFSDTAGPVPDALPAAPARTSGLPIPLARITGRAEFQNQVIAQLQQQRFVTIAGPGGIGKTTVAVAVADAVQASFPDGAYFLELAAVASPALVAASLALALGLANFAADPAPGVIAWLRPRRALLVLDSCERVVDGAAVLAEQVLRSAPGVHVLATSREPLRAEGERVLRIPALELPPPFAGQTAKDALKYSAVQLFIERASALLDRFEFRDADAPAVIKICSRLGGIALAIELAASHVTTFDLQTLADLLDDRLGLLARGRRTALPRHQTMRAVLAWSYEALQDRESLVLRRLAVFEAAFALQAACAVAGQDLLDAAAIVTSLGSLVDKSLIVAEISDSGVNYRLLDTTRAYAREKLDASGERAAVERWHARHVLAVFQQAPVEWSRQLPARWLATYRHEAASGLAALGWAFASESETGLALDLAAAVGPILFEVSLVQECRAWASRALDVLSRLDRPDPLRMLRLRATLGAALMYTDGPLPSTVQVWHTVLEEATSVADAALESRALWALWTANIYGGEPRQALDFAQRFISVVTRQGDIARMLMGERLVGACLHALGEHGPARERFEGMLARYSPVHHRWQTLGSQIDQGTMVRSTLSRIEWLQGYPDRAMALRAQALDGVRTAEHAISLCYVLAASSIPVAWEAGDREAAQAALKLLATTAAENGLYIWRATARCLELASWEPGDRPFTVGQLQDALHELRTTGYLLPGTWLAGLLARTAAALHDPGAGLAMVDRALADCARTGEAWCTPELLRTKAALMHSLAPSAPTGEVLRLLDDALVMARGQGAKSWELRIAMTRVRMFDAGARPAVLAELRGIYAGFVEGLGTADLVAAKVLLDE